MDQDEQKKELSGMPLTQIAELLGLVKQELDERDLYFIGESVGIARDMLLRRLYGVRGAASR